MADDKNDKNDKKIKKFILAYYPNAFHRSMTYDEDLAKKAEAQKAAAEILAGHEPEAFFGW